jgi:hypothetical protein
METHIQNLVFGLSASEDVQVIVAGDSIRGQVDRMDGAVITRVPTLGVVASMPAQPCGGICDHRSTIPRSVGHYAS